MDAVGSDWPARFGWVMRCCTMIELRSRCRVIHLGILAGVVSNISCGGSADTATSPRQLPAVASVTINAPRSAIRIGETLQLTTTATDASGKAVSGRPVTWESTAPSVASVSSAGLVTALASGETAIRATSEGTQATVTISVTPVPVATIIIAPTAVQLFVGGSNGLTVQVHDSAGRIVTDRAVAWTSGVPSVATVSASGLVTGVGVGTAFVTATVGGKSATATVSVSLASLSVTCSPSVIRLPQSSVGTASCTINAPSGLGGSVTLRGTGLPSGVTLGPFDSTAISLNSGGTTTVFLNAEVGSSVAPGEYALRVTAVGTGISESGTVQALVVTATGPRVHMVYLLPSDRAYDPRVALGMDRAIRHLQIWYQEQMGNGKTFVINNPTVQVIRSANPASYFAMSSWARSTAEAFAAIGSRFYDSNAVSNIYLPVVTDGQGGAASAALLGNNDVLGIAGEELEGTTVARFVGGLGHEMGHAFGLSHPPGCDSGKPLQDSNALMCFGYAAYPATYLTPADKTQLNSSPFFTSGVVVTHTLFDSRVLRPVPQP